MAVFRGNKPLPGAFSWAVGKRLFRRQRPELGSIPVPDAEIQTFFDGEWTASDRLPGGAPDRWRGPRSRLRRRRGPDPARFVIGRGPEARVEVPPELLGGMEQVCLLDNAGRRPRLRLVRGMDGEVKVGVARLGARDIMRDPSLRDGHDSAAYALPYGAEARIQIGRWTFLIRRAPIVSA